MMRSESEIRDRRDGCRLEQDAHLHPQNGVDAYNAAVLQGWLAALTWVVEEENPRDRTDEIREHLGVDGN